MSTQDKASDVPVESTEDNATDTLNRDELYDILQSVKTMGDVLPKMAPEIMIENGLMEGISVIMLGARLRVLAKKIHRIYDSGKQITVIPF